MKARYELKSTIQILGVIFSLYRNSNFWNVKNILVFLAIQHSIPVLDECSHESVMNFIFRVLSL